MRSAIQQALDTELKLQRLSSVPILETPPSNAEQLLQNANWVLRPETLEFEIGRRLLMAAQQGSALGVDPVSVELDILQRDNIFYDIEKSTSLRALELGFLIQHVSRLRGYFAMAFLDPRQRERRLDRKYPADQFRPDFSSPIIPFDAQRFRSRLRPNKQGIPKKILPFLMQLFKFCALRMERQELCTATEIGRVFNVSAKTIDNWVKRSQESVCRDDTGVFLRIRADFKIEPVLLDLKLMREDMSVDEEEMRNPLSIDDDVVVDDDTDEFN